MRSCRRWALRIHGPSALLATSTGTSKSLRLLASRGPTHISSETPTHLDALIIARNQIRPTAGRRRRALRIHGTSALLATSTGTSKSLRLLASRGPTHISSETPTHLDALIIARNQIQPTAGRRRRALR